MMDLPARLWASLGPGIDEQWRLLKGFTAEHWGLLGQIAKPGHTGSGLFYFNDPPPRHVRELAHAGLLALQEIWYGRPGYVATPRGQIMASTILMDAGGHLVSTTSEEDLHRFAARLGLKRRWFQNRGRAEAHPHYDLTSNMARQRALMEGARLVDRRELAARAWWAKGASNEQARA